MFGHDAQPTRIYRYGAKAPVTQGAHIDAQMRGMARYRNALVQLEHERRAAVDAVVAEDAELAILRRAVALISDSIDARRETISQRNAAARRRTATPLERQVMGSLRRVAAGLRREEKACRQALYAREDIQARLAAIEDDSRARHKVLRADSALYWGNYLVVEQGLGSMRRGAPPRFRRYDGSGKIATQLQQGLSVEALESQEDLRLRLQPLNAEAWRAAHVPRRERRTVLWMRVGSEGRAPVWAEIPFVMHRPLPEGCRVQWVYLLRTRIGVHWKWAVELVVAREGGFAKPDTAADGAAGVDLGWRLVPEGLRVAYWVGDDGAEGSLVLPQALLDRERKVRELQSIRQVNFEAMRDGLWIWAQGQRAVPEWLGARLAHLRQWKSSGWLARVALAWRGQRFVGDEEIYEDLEAWRKQDKHLLSWESHQRARDRRQRNELYRRFAAQMRRRYRTLRLEDTDFRALARQPMPEADAVSGAVREYRMFAAVGRLREWLVESAAVVERIDTAHSTQRCTRCAVPEPPATTRQDTEPLILTCPACGHREDQDRRAAIWHLRGGASGPVLAAG